MFDIIKKLFIHPAQRNEQLDNITRDIKGKMFIFVSEKGNPFASSYKIVLDDKGGWVQWQYVFRGTGPSSSPPESTPKSEFLKFHTEIDRAPF